MLTGDSSGFCSRLLCEEGLLICGRNRSVWLVERAGGDRPPARLAGHECAERRGGLFRPLRLYRVKAVCIPRVERAFREEALSEPVFFYAIRQATERWGDARRALTLLRWAGELANDCGLGEVDRRLCDQLSGRRRPAAGQRANGRAAAPSGGAHRHREPLGLGDRGGVDARAGWAVGSDRE